MTPLDSFLAHWYFHAPNLLLAALMYTLLGRYLLSLFFAPDSDRVLWRVFVRVTDPVVGVIRAITPHLVPTKLVVLLAVVWLFMARITLFLAFAAIGFQPVSGS